MVEHTLSFTAMMALMMAPTVAPWVRAYHAFSEPRAIATAMFAAGYLLVWIAFSVALALAQHVLALPRWFGPAALVAAGVYQFTPLKQACLTHCRNPLSFLLTRWRNGPMPAFELGVRHGLFCLGCCWALMLTMIAVGMAHHWWMLALAAFTFAEQVSPWGPRLRVPAGLLLIAAGGTGLVLGIMVR